MSSTAPRQELNRQSAIPATPTLFLSPETVPDEIRQLTKCNLHTHLEGSVRPQTFVELAHEEGIALPVSPADLPRMMQVTGEERNLVDYLAKIIFNYPILKNALALRRISREAVEDAAHCNVRYFELRAGPVNHATPDLSVREVIAAILAGLEDAEAQYGVTCRLIISALRHHPPAVNIALARTALEFRGAGVVGFDIAGDELQHPAALNKEAFDIAREGGLGITVHAGEAGGSEEVRYALTELGATRIGHGVHSIQDPNTIALINERGATLEICPTSNVHTNAVPSIHDHPVRQFIQAGVRVTIGDDDPITSRTNLSRELALLAQEFHFTIAELHALQLTGIESSFLEDAARRKQLRQEFSRHQM
ncbi:MAG: adenosine deaminase [Anaerolineae bacterium]